METDKKWETMELPTDMDELKPNNARQISVLGASEKAGASFVTELLKREKTFTGVAGRIADLGEERHNNSNPEQELLLIVIDGRVAVPGHIAEMLGRIIENSEVSCGVVINRFNTQRSGNANACKEELMKLSFFCEEKIPIFFIPEFETQTFRDLYNFIFYS